MSDRFQLYSELGGNVGEIRRDETSGLPLLSEEGKVLILTNNYLPLPYSVVEYGCGQKASIVLRMLALHHDIPPHAMWRGLVIERDLREETLNETDPDRRPHALTARNPLARRVTLDDPVFRRFFDENVPGVSLHPDSIRVGDAELHLFDRVQFLAARSHVFPVLTFWDEDSGHAVDRVIDLTLERRGLFPVSEIRSHLRSAESWIFLAPLTGPFRLEEDHLTPAQRGAVAAELGEGEDLESLSRERHAELFRAVSGAPRGSQGDPLTWSFVNNVDVRSDEGSPEEYLSGYEGGGRSLSVGLIEARENDDEESVGRLREELLDLAREIDLRGQLQDEAERSEKELAPLAEVANAIAFFHSLRALADRLHDADDLSRCLVDPDRLQDLHGIGVRLRRRIESAARVSRDERGRIDARALNDRYFKVVAETIRQMNEAGLSVFLDGVGNVHGLTLSEETRDAVLSGKEAPRDVVRGAIGFVSHVDTVADAGKYDGRLGVFSGVEVVEVLRDLGRFFDWRPDSEGGVDPLLVSAYSGEEMTFTGRGVSLPGSAAVTGFASVEDVMEMTNTAGERYGDRLAAMGRDLLERRGRGEIEFHGLSEDGENPFAGAPDPTEFLPLRTWERHIEQGLVLHRRGVPLALTHAIAGIRLEDFHFRGERAEAAAWEWIHRCSARIDESAGETTRFTCGVFEAAWDGRTRKVSDATEWILLGSNDHAGSTSPRDRRDAGFLAARLVDRFHAECGALGVESDRPRPVVGGGRLEPGRNRNVVPGKARVLLGYEDSPSEEIRGQIEGALEECVESANAALEQNEKGPFRWKRRTWSDPVPVAGRVRVSMDLRDAEEERIESLRRVVGAIASEVASEFGVEVSGRLHQDSPPVSLEPAGVILQMERSYGGSHNPRETEMAGDVLRGTLFQLALVRDILEGGGDDSRTLLEQAFEWLPLEWREGGGGFISGGLHDTANLAMGLSRERRDQSNR